MANGPPQFLDTYKAWPADKVERRKVADLVPYARNARTHSDAQVAQIAASIREWGWTTPVLIDEAGGLIAGHGRVLAARKLGIVDVPAMVANGWSEAQKRAYILADNKLTLNAGWDDDLLKIELGDLKELDFDLSLIGFGDDELAALLDTTEGLTDPDDAPAVEAQAVSVLGDAWILGRHRLVCGDSTNPEHIERLMVGKQADLCFTSPPYGQQRDYKSGGIADWDKLMQGVFGILPVKHEAQVLVNLGMIHRDGEWMPYWDGWVDWMRVAGWRRFGWYVWDQGFGMPGQNLGRLASSHEWIFHFNHAPKLNKTIAKKPENLAIRVTKVGRKKDGTVNKASVSSDDPSKIPDSVIRVMRHQARGIEMAHPAVFPVDLVSEMPTAFSDPDDIVYEPFGGSGTQIISAQKNGRTCLAMEIAPQYVDVAIRRWQNFTGQSATLDGEGRTFAEIEASRIGVKNAD